MNVAPVFSPGTRGYAGRNSAQRILVQIVCLVCLSPRVKAHVDCRLGNVGIRPNTSGGYNKYFAGFGYDNIIYFRRWSTSPRYYRRRRKNWAHLEATSTRAGAGRTEVSPTRERQTTVEGRGCSLTLPLSHQKNFAQKFSKIHTFWFHHFSRKHVQTTMRCVSLSLPLFSLSAVAFDVHFVALERLSSSRFYRSRGIARGGVCLRAFSFFFFRCFLRARGVAVPKCLTSSRSLFNHHAVKSSTYKPASAVTKSGQSSGRCARGFFSFFRSL